MKKTHYTFFLALQDARYYMESVAKKVARNPALEVHWNSTVGWVIYNHHPEKPVGLMPPSQGPEAVWATVYADGSWAHGPAYGFEDKEREEIWIPGRKVVLMSDRLAGYTDGAAVLEGAMGVIRSLHMGGDMLTVYFPGNNHKNGLYVIPSAYLRLAMPGEAKADYERMERESKDK